MSRPVRVLLVEDNEDDATLVAIALRIAGFAPDCRRVQDAAALRAALSGAAWDAVVSDYNMPGFDGVEALRIVRAADPELPFVLVSSAIGEETAVQAMKAGADDYVMKGNLARLGAAVERELREADVRREKRRAEAKVARLDRVREVMSAVNAMIVRARDRSELFREAARILVETGDLRLAWIGVASAGGGIARIAVEGAEPGLGRLAGWTSRHADAQVVRDVARDGVANVTNDITQVADAELAAECRRLSIGARAVIPIAAAGSVAAVLVLYARDPGFFDADEMRLVRELAGDLAFGLEHIERQERLDYLAYHDQVTGLANRNLFSERLAQWIAAAQREHRRLAVAVIDIDRFRTLNETLGRQAADRLLRSVGERIEGCVAEASHVAHIGSAHFAVVLDRIGAAEDAAHAVHQGMRACFSEPLVIDGNECRISARAGIAIFPDDGAEPALLVRNAESAAERAKSSGHPYLFYTEEMTARVAERVALENRLRGALARGEFEVFYQPKVSAAERRLLSLEALLRWRTPEAGLVSPAEFIGVLEETGLICDVGAWVLRQVARDRRAWLELGLEAPRVAVNVSVVQVRQRDFVATLREAIGGFGAGIDLELTESLLVDDVQDCVDKLCAVRELGVGVAIDDFGTGYSSLAYLAKLPVEALKIDRSFIAGLGSDRHATAMAATIISMAHSLGLAVIAEGVETEAQARSLRSLGCEQIQGFLTGRPAPFAETGALLALQDPVTAASIKVA